MPTPLDPQSKQWTQVHGSNFDELKSRAAEKGFRAVYIDRMREQAVMESMFMHPMMAQASHDQIRSSVSQSFSENLDRVGGFSEAYRHERAVVKTIGRQLAERKFDLTLQIMHLLVYRLEEKNQATASEIDRARKRFLAVVAETASAFSAFNMDVKEVLRRVERQPILVKHGISNHVKAILEGVPSTSLKSTLGSILTRPITFSRPVRSTV